MGLGDVTGYIRDLDLDKLKHLDLGDRRVQVAIGTAVVTGIVSLYAIRQFTKKRYNLPPGPRPWPIVGNMLCTLYPIDKSTFSMLRQKHKHILNVEIG